MDWPIAIWGSVGLIAALGLIALVVWRVTLKPEAPDRRRLRERLGYKGDTNNPTLKGGTALEPIIGHLALLIRKLAEDNDEEDSTRCRRDIIVSATRVEDFFRARWDAPEEPTT